MERAARLIRGMKLKGTSGETGSSLVSGEDIARAGWPVAVGKKIAAHSGRIRLFGTLLVVEVEDAVWQSQLTTLESQIRTRLEQTIGPGIVSAIEFQVGTPRRAPGRAVGTENTGTDSMDEAARIQDPVLRRLYITSRRKASA